MLRINSSMDDRSMDSCVYCLEYQRLDISITHGIQCICRLSTGGDNDRAWH